MAYDEDEYYDYDRGEACDHLDFEVDWDGRARCIDCGTTWMASPEDVKRYDALMAHAAARWKRMERRERWLQRWYRWTAWLRSPAPATVAREDMDDEIPF